MTDRRYVFALAGLAAGYVALAGWLPPTDDELYYWCWSRDLQLSYYDHPPLTAYLIRAATGLFGHSLLAVRLPAVVASVVVLSIVGRLSRPRSLLPWVVLTPLFTFGAVLVTPDTPLLMFWALYLLWLTRAHRRLSEAEKGVIPLGSWIIGGVLLGLGALGKYTTALAVPAGFLSFALAGTPWRRWLPGYVFHGAVSFVVFLPVVVFNIENDFAPLRYQWGHAMSADGRGLKSFGEFVGVQVLLFGTLPLALFPWVVGNLRTLAADPRLRACACLYAVPFGFFLYKSLRGPLEGNWALAAYLGFWPVAAHWYAARRGSKTARWLTAGSFVLPAGCVAFVAVHLAHPIRLIPPDRDRLTRLGAKADLARQVAAAVRECGGVPVYAITYQWVAQLRFQGVDARQIDGASRPSHFTMRPEHVTDADPAYVFAEGPLVPEYVDGFGPPEVVATFPLVVRGAVVDEYKLLRYTRPSPPVPKLR